MTVVVSDLYVISSIFKGVDHETYLHLPFTFTKRFIQKDSQHRHVHIALSNIGVY